MSRPLWCVGKDWDRVAYAAGRQPPLQSTHAGGFQPYRHSTNQETFSNGISHNKRPSPSPFPKPLLAS